MKINNQDESFSANSYSVEKTLGNYTVISFEVEDLIFRIVFGLYKWFVQKNSRQFLLQPHLGSKFQQQNIF